MNKKLINTINLYFLLTFFFSQVFSFSLCAKPISYKLDTNNSKVGFSVKHKITKDVYGEFLKSKGEVILNNKTNEILKVEAKIDVNSIDTGIYKRDKHLRSSDFFHAEKYPFIFFESSKRAYSSKCHDTYSRSF